MRELRKKTEKDLLKQLRELRATTQKKVLAMAMGGAKQTQDAVHARRLVARIKTVLGEKRTLSKLSAKKA